MKKRLLISIACLFVLLAAGCSDDEKEETSAENEEETCELGDYNVDLSGEVIEEDESFIVKGKSNLLPESILTGEVVVDKGETVFSEVEVPVEEDGSFEMELE